MTVRHFLSSDDVSASEQAELIRRGRELKETRRTHPRSRARSLEGRSVGLLFEKPSTRTRVSFDVAVFELGGNPIALSGAELQLGRGETLEDTGRVLSQYLDAVVVRTFEQERVERLAAAASIPVINALSDQEHPCQALGDLLTIDELFDERSSVHLTYVGDGNNVAHSLLLAGAKAGLAKVAVATPAGYEPNSEVVTRAEAMGAGTEVVITNDPHDAAKGCDVIYTDVWASMGQEAEHSARLQAFQGFALNADLLADAPSAFVMHCLPAHRGEEITDEVIDGPKSVVWQQAQNRLHAQKALLEWLLT